MLEIGVEILKFDNRDLNKLMYKSYAELYCKIWREDPWLEFFWTVDGVKDDLKKHLKLPGAQIFLALLTNNKDRKVVGFTLGQTVGLNDMRKISSSKKLDYLFVDSQTAFYINELGIDPDFRGYGLGRALSERLIKQAKRLGHSQIILRTDLRSIPARTLYARLGFKELPIIDGVETKRSYWLLSV